MKSVKATRLALIPMSSPRDRFPCLFIGRPAPLGLALIPKLLALGQRQLHFDSAIFKVQADGNQREALLLGLADQLADFLAVHQQFAGTKRSVVVDVAMLVRTDMRVQ